MALSDELTKLADRTKSLEDSAAAVSAKNKADLDARKSEVSATLEATKTRIGDDLVSAGDQASSDWANLKKSVSDGIDSAREKLDDRRADRAAKRADHQADDAEAYAEDAIDFALYAIDEAEYAVLDAAAARAEADSAAA